MEERPILFSAPMVRALLKGRKTQTRRIVKGIHAAFDENRPEHCPYGKPGDRLWVREKTVIHGSIPQQLIGYAADGCKRTEEWEKSRPSIHMQRAHSRITLEITEVRVQRLQEISDEDAAAEGLHIQIGDTKAGHVWNGLGYHDHVSFDHHGFRTFHVTMGSGNCICHAGQKLKLSAAKCAYRILWESINGNGSWDANPWVWAVTFSVSPKADKDQPLTHE